MTVFVYVNTRKQVGVAELVKRQWEALGVAPGEWMLKGMAPKRIDWLKRVLVRFGNDGACGTGSS
jgi:hypothetical protein